MQCWMYSQCIMYIVLCTVDWVRILNPNSWMYCVFNIVDVSGHNLESSQTWGFQIQCLHYKPVSNYFCSMGRGGCGIKFVSRGDVNIKEETSNTFVLIRSRIRPLGKAFRSTVDTEPVFVNVYGAQESTPRNQFRQPMQPGRPVRKIGLSYRPARLGIDSWALKRSTNTGSEWQRHFLACIPSRWKN